MICNTFLCLDDAIPPFGRVKPRDVESYERHLGIHPYHPLIKRVMRMLVMISHDRSQFGLANNVKYFVLPRLALRLPKAEQDLSYATMFLPRILFRANTFELQNTHRHHLTTSSLGPQAHAYRGTCLILQFSSRSHIRKDGQRHG